MAIRLDPTGERFMVALRPPDGEWRSTDALAATDVIAKLAELGCHSTDITGAPDATGLDWRPVGDAEVGRRRNESA
jgi:hypothetical protein